MSANRVALDLEPIKSREAKATKGPWLRRTLDVIAFKSRVICALWGAHGKYELEEADAEFIAHARQDIPALVAEVEQLRAELEARRVSSSPDDVMDIYVPGCWSCPKCDFALSSQTLFVGSGTIGCTLDQVMRMSGEFCPNDGESMRRVTWRERAADHHKWGESLMNEIIAATGAEHLPGALEAIKEKFRGDR